MKKLQRKNKSTFEETREKLHKGTISYKEMKKEAMRDPKLRKAYEALQPEFEFRSALIAARIKGETTQEEIAKRAGTTQSAIARFESGRNSPTLAFMQRLAEALGKKLEIRLVNAKT